MKALLLFLLAATATATDITWDVSRDMYWPEYRLHLNIGRGQAAATQALWTALPDFPLPVIGAVIVTRLRAPLPKLPPGTTLRATVSAYSGVFKIDGKESEEITIPDTVKISFAGVTPKVHTVESSPDLITWTAQPIYPLKMWLESNLRTWGFAFDYVAHEPQMFFRLRAK